jgi:hypothetical protein
MATDIKQFRTSVRARIWQTFAQSGVNLSSIPKADLESLVDQVTDNVLLEVDALLGERQDMPEVLINRAETGEGEEEKILWQGRPFLSIFEYYTISTERLRIVHGFLGKDHENIELVRVNDLDWDHGIFERALGIGDILVHSVDQTEPTVVLRNVTDPAKVFEILRAAMLDARKKHHIIYEQAL